MTETHFDSSDKSAPVISEFAIRVMLVLVVMVSLHAELVDVEVVFLNGRYDNGEEIFVKVPDGMRKWYSPHILLRLLRTMYGTK